MFRFAQHDNAMNEVSSSELADYLSGSKVRQ